LILQENWKTLGPKLRGKIHIAVGEADDYYLNNAVHLLDDFLKETNPPADARITYGPGRGHCWSNLSEAQMMREMAAAVEQAVPSTPQSQAQNSGTTTRLRGVSAVNENVAWASGAAGTVLRTVDGGARWDRVSVPNAAADKVAERLGNTRAVCRKCYIHPEIFTTYIEGSLLLEVKDKVEAELRDDLAGLKPEEAAVLTLLQARLSLTLKDKLIESTARLN